MGCCNVFYVLLMFICRHVYDEVNEEWNNYDRNNDGLISWKEYKHKKKGDGENTN